MSGKGKILYLTDLDGTLLQPDGTLSEFTRDTLNRLIEKGMPFSYATARSVETASPLLKGLNVKLPAVVHNGMFLQEPSTRKILRYERFSEEDKETVASAFFDCGLCPVTQSVIEGRNRFSFLRTHCSREQWGFVFARLHDGRAREIFRKESLLEGDVYYFVCIDEEERLRAVYDKLKESYRCLFQRDMYSGDPWLEVMPRHGGKACAILWLKELLGFERVVCFGDQINDIPMFEIADECYAVGNAAEELKAISSGIIGRNTEDGVARWLDKHALY